MGFRHGRIKKKVRNVPDSSRMTKEYSATSPNINDQWSGRPCVRTREDPGTADSGVNEIGDASGFGLGYEGGGFSC